MDSNTQNKYITNPEKEKKEEQVKILIERHNFLVDQVSILEQDFIKKEENLQRFKKEIQEDLAQEKKQLEQTKKLLRDVEKYKKNIGIEFKQIIKTPIFEKLKKRIDSLNYEEYIYRDELYRKLKK